MPGETGRPCRVVRENLPGQVTWLGLKWEGGSFLINVRDRETKDTQLFIWRPEKRPETLPGSVGLGAKGWWITQLLSGRRPLPGYFCFVLLLFYICEWLGDIPAEKSLRITKIRTVGGWFLLKIMVGCLSATSLTACLAAQQPQVAGITQNWGRPPNHPCGCLVDCDWKFSPIPAPVQDRLSCSPSWPGTPDSSVFSSQRKNISHQAWL